MAQNYRDTLTFERVYRDGWVAQSYIDVTLVSESIVQLVKRWHVLDEYKRSLKQTPNYHGNGAG